MNALSVTVLGCSGTYAAAGEACSGYLVQSATTSLWVDCGPGTLANLQEHVDLENLDAIVVSHHHPDHCAELPVVYNAVKYFTECATLKILTTVGVQRVTDSFHPDGDSSDLFKWEIVEDRAVSVVGDIMIRFSRTDHPVETLAMSFTLGDKSIFYTADTGPNWSLSNLGRNPSLVLGEGTLTETTNDLRIPHICCSHLASEASKVEADRLVVTHIPPNSDKSVHLAEAEMAFSGIVDLAATGSTFTV
tara:strand:- start:769 stop:1512 length:744 start_codon:yes stop_codon:yes gene_type:complete